MKDNEQGPERGGVPWLVVLTLVLVACSSGPMSPSPRPNKPRRAVPQPASKQTKEQKAKRLCKKPIEYMAKVPAGWSSSWGVEGRDRHLVMRISNTSNTKQISVQFGVAPKPKRIKVKKGGAVKSVHCPDQGLGNDDARKRLLNFCRQTPACENDGACSLHEHAYFNGDVSCTQGSNEDCAQTAGCKKQGRCSYFAEGGGSCGVGRTSDCKQSTECTKKGRCYFIPMPDESLEAYVYDYCLTKAQYRKALPKYRKWKRDQARLKRQQERQRKLEAKRKAREERRAARAAQAAAYADESPGERRRRRLREKLTSASLSARKRTALGLCRRAVRVIRRNIRRVRSRGSATEAMQDAVDDAKQDYMLAEAIFRGIGQQILSSVSEDDSMSKRARVLRRVKKLQAVFRRNCSVR